MKKYIPFILIAISLFLNNAFCQTAVTSYTITNNTTVSATSNSNIGWNASSPYPSSTTYTNFYGQSSGSGAGLERIITGFAAGGYNYVPVASGGGSPFDVVWANRHPSYGGDTLNMLYEYTTSSGNNLYHAASYIGTLENVINSTVCNRGSDNLFSNSPTTRANFERIDLVKTTGIICIDPLRQGFLINERGGNDNFKCAAISTLNGSNIVTALGSLTNVTTGNWGAVGPAIVTRVMSRAVATDNYLRAKQDLTSQNVSGVFISFASLGIGIGSTIYGISLFPNDVTSGMDLINLTNVPTNTDAGASGGLDLMAGEIYAVEASLLSSAPGVLIVNNNNMTAVLKWQNLSPQVLFYKVQRSVGNNLNFKEIATVYAGNTELTYTEVLKSDSKYYYRLMIVKKDGTEGFSNTAMVNNKLPSTSKIKPTLIQNGELIRVFFNSSDPAIAVLFSAGGQFIQLQRINGSANCNFETNGLKKGLYYIKVSVAERTTITPVLIQ